MIITLRFLLIFAGPKKPTESTMQEAISKVAAKRTDYSVGVEGESNKAF